MSEEYKDVFICVKCRNPRVTKLARIVKNNALITGKCLKGHSFNLKLPIEQEHKWIGYLRESVYKCRCGMPLEEHKVKVGKKKTQLILKCTKHKQVTTIDTLLWNTMAADRETQKTLEQKYEPPTFKTAKEPEKYEKNIVKTKKKEVPEPQKWQPT
ncbi:MAG: hypothetical protein KIH08_07075 [Candidatus Freyarchaeota archaeon]|nr:hypothetical protein [Candidatus Jordarchaeia archaeon]MBS7268771.1 hypothetical protein [Candidatus Jordarchaeia archaeon]MBS7278245.1 hypothetical protein [Candidatus Jordarchaeia archaeon]